MHRPALAHGSDDRCEVEQYHSGGFLGRFGALVAHGRADIGLLERRRFVHAVARHGHDKPVVL